MLKEQTREKVTEKRQPPPLLTKKPAIKAAGTPVAKVVKATPRKKVVEKRLKEHEDDDRFQHELEEMRETHDLDDIDDDVEDEATILEWRAEEHNHKPKSAGWFMGLAAGATVIVATQLFIFANFMGAITIASIAGMTYYIAQQKPKISRYRVMIDGVAVNNTLYHFDDLESFNVLYEPGETMTVILRSKHRFAPFVHLELGDADPVEVREVLYELMDEDQSLEEPMADIIARRLGF